MEKVTKSQFLTNGKTILIVTRGCSKDGEREFRGTILATSESYFKPGTTKRFNKDEFGEVNLYYNLNGLLEEYLD